MVHDSPSRVFFGTSFFGTGSIDLVLHNRSRKTTTFRMAYFWESRGATAATVALVVVILVLRMIFFSELHPRPVRGFVDQPTNFKKNTL